ncbi:hypothetical protein B296_00009540 [Ensete ventricosum]|uniref:Uncharacterized protein n=1 Tax=Ensete ventricosum TaxID=4639 RepID=A0A427AMF0_ENSVE|nr:hypothetical protein B296_00009540 [Ensete ventricosum]
MHRLDTVGNSPGVCQELVEGIGCSSGSRKGVRQKKTETCRKIIEGSQKACRDLGIGPGSDDAVGSRREFARRFAEWIKKLAGNMKGDHREKTEGLVARMLEATGLAEVGSKLSLWSLSFIIVES